MRRGLRRSRSDEHPSRACAKGARVGRDGGQATVEFALLLPLIVMGALAIVQTALVARDQIAVVHAAREAARAASVDPNPARARAAAAQVLDGASTHLSARPAVGNQIRVEVSYKSRTDMPLVGSLFPDPTLRADAVMRVER